MDTERQRQLEESILEYFHTEFPYNGVLSFKFQNNVLVSTERSEKKQIERGKYHGKGKD